MNDTSSRCATAGVGLVGLGLIATLMWCAPQAVGTLRAQPAPAPRAQFVQWRCEVSYLPTRATWTRHVTLVHDNQTIKSIWIDGQAVHRFDVFQTLVLTSQDNERVQFDATYGIWQSAFRDQATGMGQCERLN